MRSRFILCLLALTLFCVESQSQSKLDGEYMLEDLRKLSHDAAEGRKTGTKGGLAAQQFLIRQFKTLGAKRLQKDFKHPFTFVTQSGDSVQGANIVGYIRGELETAIVISAHFDHLGVINGEIYNGADDNASSVAAMLSMIEYFKRNKPRHTMVFAALDAEESGLKGAYALVDDPVFPLDKVKLNVNMDMISQNSKNQLYVAGTHHYPRYKSILERVSTGSLRLMFGHDRPELGSDDWTNSSDHAAFHAKGIPFIYFGVEDHEHYHKPSDTFENVNRAFYIKAANAILDCILTLDKAIN